MSDLPISLPQLIAIGAGIFIIIIAVMVLLPQMLKKDFVTFFEINRRKIIDKKKGENFSGLVVVEGGGFVDRETAKIDLVYGRAFLERGKASHRRKRTPIYITRSLDSAPLHFTKKGIFVDGMKDETEFDAREDMAAEIAVAEAAKRAIRGDFIGKLMAVTIVILGLSLAAMAVVIAMKGAQLS